MVNGNSFGISLDYNKFKLKNRQIKIDSLDLLPIHFSLFATNQLVLCLRGKLKLWIGTKKAEGIF